jgi:2-hydroxychromene-2-carboxylate isomerase
MERLRAEVDAGLARGVFGSPFIFVDGEPFWGSDRLPMIEEWLKRGGW